MPYQVDYQEVKHVGLGLMTARRRTRGSGKIQERNLPIQTGHQVQPYYTNWAPGATFLYKLGTRYSLPIQTGHQVQPSYTNWAPGTTFLYKLGTR